MNMHMLWRGRASLALVLLLFGGLGTGCQSARVGYSFQPVVTEAPIVRTAPTASVEALPEPSGPQTAAAAVAPVAAARKSPRRVARALQRVGVALPARGVLAATQYRSGVSRPAAARPAAPQAPAELGLGTTVLGVLGLVVLPIGLIGLLLGGGLVWGILAGLGALAVLVAWWDPFG